MPDDFPDFEGDLTAVVSMGEVYVSLVIMPDGSSVRAFLGTRRGNAEYRFGRDDAQRVHEALGRLLKATAKSVNEAVERARV